MAAAVQWADTPEKWAAAQKHYGQYDPQIASIPFEAREQALLQLGQMGEYLKNTGPGEQYTLGPGAKRFDAKGNMIAEAPFAPRAMTVGEGQQVIEYQPGGSQGGPLTVDRLLPAIVAQESRGNYAARNAGTGAMGAYQVMPQTGKVLAERLGLPWRPDLMTSSSPEGKQYQDKVGRAAVEEAFNASGGNPAIAAAYYHGGSDRKKWGPKTRQYVREVTARLGDGGGARVIAQGQPKTAASEKPPSGYRWTQDGALEPIPGGPAVGRGADKADQPYSQSALDAFDRAFGTAQRLLKHKGFGAAVGSGFDPQSWGTFNPVTGKSLAGTDAANFNAELDAMKAQVFLPMVQSMKGMGALSNAEGQKLTDAIGALDTNMSEGAFRQSLGRIIGDLTAYKSRGAPQAKQPAASGGWGKAQVID